MHLTELCLINCGLKFLYLACELCQRHLPLILTALNNRDRNTWQNTLEFALLFGNELIHALSWTFSYEDYARSTNTPEHHVLGLWVKVNRVAFKSPAAADGPERGTCGTGLPIDHVVLDCLSSACKNKHRGQKRKRHGQDGDVGNLVEDESKAHSCSYDPKEETQHNPAGLWVMLYGQFVDLEDLVVPPCLLRFLLLFAGLSGDCFVGSILACHTHSLVGNFIVLRPISPRAMKVTSRWAKQEAEFEIFLGSTKLKLWITAFHWLGAVQSDMRTFTEQDRVLLAAADVTLGRRLTEESPFAPQRSQRWSGQLADGQQVHVLLIELGTGASALESRAYWHEIIQRTTKVYEPGMQRLIRSIDLGDACALVVPPTTSLGQHLGGQVGIVRPVAQALQELGLAMLAMIGQGLATTHLELDNVRFTLKGKTQLGIAAEFGIGDQEPHAPVSQLHLLVEEMRAQQLITADTWQKLDHIFKPVLEQENGANNLGDLLIALTAFLETDLAGQETTLIRRQPRVRKTLRIRGAAARIVAAAGVSLIAVSVYLVLVTQPWFAKQQSDVVAEHKAGSQTRQEELQRAAATLVSQRFATIEQVSKYQADIADVTKVVVADSPAHDQLTGLLHGLLEDQTEVELALTKIEPTEIIGDYGAEAVVRVHYELQQDHVRDGARIAGQLLTEELDLSIVKLPDGWRMTAANVVGP